MKRAMVEDERYAAAPRSRPMRQRRKEASVSLDSKTKRAMEDERFAAAPRFRPTRRKEDKVALDSRFAPMLTDPMFSSSEAPVDKRGRRRRKKRAREPEKLIREEGDHEVEEEDDVLVLDDDEEESCTSSDDGQEDHDAQHSVGGDIAHYLMARHDGTPMIDKETHRLAVVNMDWDHIKAVDLYMVMTSCILKGGRVLSVSIYPTEFGLKCMNVETTQGPFALIGADGDSDGDNGGEDDNIDDDDGEEDSDLDSENENNKLRTYELNRLRYYYAVVVCDSSATADHLYTTLDGTEFLKTGNVFDLQFIYDSREFKYPARDVATEAPLNYKEPDFETRALQHTKVKPTWDDDEPKRKILLPKFEDKFDELIEYIASSGSSSEDGEDDFRDESLPNGVEKRKLTTKERLALLLQGNKSDEELTDDQDMEIAFNMELEGLSKRILERKNIETKTVWEMHQEKKDKRKARKRLSKDDDDYGDQDSSDDFLDDEKSDDEVKSIKKNKVKAKGKGKDKPRVDHYEPEATKEELELLVAAGQDIANGAKGYNIKRNSKKGKKGKDSVKDKVGEIDLSKDERFSPMFTSHLYALDPTDPQYKRSATSLLRKRTGKKGAHVVTLDSGQPPLEKSSPPVDSSLKNNWKRDTCNLQMLSAVNSLKRNLAAFKKASNSEADSRTIA